MLGSASRRSSVCFRSTSTATWRRWALQAAPVRSGNGRCIGVACHLASYCTAPLPSPPQGLFERHKLLVATQLCMCILHKQGELSQEKFEYLLRGPKVGMAAAGGTACPPIAQAVNGPSRESQPKSAPAAGGGPRQPRARVASRLMLGVGAGAQGDCRLPLAARGSG